MKQSNWILGIGIFVALILIVGSIWVNTMNSPKADTVQQNSEPEIEESINKVRLKSIRPLTTIIKALF